MFGKFFKETSMMESVLLKLQAYSATECNSTMHRFPAYFFQKMSGKLAKYCREKFMLYQCSNWFVWAEHFWRNLKNSDVFTGKPT